GTPSDEGDRTMDESARPSDDTAGAGLDALSSRGVLAPERPVTSEYPEWDFNIGAYRPRGATVVAYASLGSNDTWATETLGERAVLARQVRMQFERLRAQRLRLPRQPDGDELDIAACVSALVDRRMGRAPDDRLYVAVHPARQPLAIALLVDVSGSTTAAVTEARTDAQRVIEVEKIALLLASEALDALGDRYAILTFASHGASDVRVAAIKHFDERNGTAVRGRISAIAPEGNTRLGAAIRHATALLGEQPVSHRLLLILSDGKPSDTDRYFEAYGVEDSRRAILEARVAGVFPFCLAVSSGQAPTYLSHLFGPAGHTVLSRPDHLPGALLRVIRHLLGAH
ncbi:MAG TPA: VWA domain-containing protein, partial [Candidatus Elarobacter sp.]|nr:VWA domain-containing protein [Candidatus Elarobacter sp.]